MPQTNSRATASVHSLTRKTAISWHRIIRFSFLSNVICFGYRHKHDWRRAVPVSASRRHVRCCWCLAAAVKKERQDRRDQPFFVLHLGAFRTHRTAQMRHHSQRNAPSQKWFPSAFRWRQQRSAWGPLGEWELRWTRASRCLNLLSTVYLKSSDVTVTSFGHPFTTVYTIIVDAVYRSLSQCRRMRHVKTVSSTKNFVVPYTSK